VDQVDQVNLEDCAHHVDLVGTVVQDDRVGP
jgi:hypothetical protein